MAEGVPGNLSIKSCNDRISLRTEKDLKGLICLLLHALRGEVTTGSR